jgi:hypothetical protein
MSRRTATYLAIRGAAAVAFVLAATVLPPGVPAALVVVTAGLVAVLSCLGSNAGGPGERAGALPQERWLASVRAPQGDWPPYPPGEATGTREATAAPAETSTS